ncbi:MAG: acyl-ACP--UDP-N-acetylglucosamine O-acyltransferase [Candidatus Omnitrophica bacterium]|nr:acyl-ACP--UDP-N-acetylglucosamine O-acyltransferase [Candidatus Omnitrophota bacterium]MDE2010005.1 acyl-ACP--UDP-N-acetylglucosamine O-acyltransferase [Candidatus Omnitrophota bacterium]MDE2215037.1 acyl-ACP--UDP-N-acetylglucosamine O-acyltransferase [Candidatus Omnitrophota bacterium]MDE2231737.1 acyl-ACP--UDP-N-acetylglucosamine O-acyltransferase [Candidatus Omnitrophota bacterium]
MEASIHKTAIVGPQVKLGSNVAIGPYSVIDGEVTLGDGVTIGAHCIVEGNTTIGRACQLFTGAVIGSLPQDRKHQKTDRVFLKIGENNVFREYVTVNPGTIEGGGETTIGDNNLFMACAHVAHDCRIGNDCVLANYVGLSGHVTIEDRAVIGGLSGVHQYGRVGYLSMIGGCSKVNQDVPPFSLVDGNPASLRGLNIVGLKRAELPLPSQRALHSAFKILFNSGLNRSHAILQVKEQLNGLPEVHQLLEFIQASKRGIS